METTQTEARFLIDAMLGHVARDLRLLGFDASYAGQRTDPMLLAAAQREGRVLVTRDRALAIRARDVPHLFLLADSRREQTREVLSRLGLHPSPDRWFTRCLRCNGSLRQLSGEEAQALLPPHVWSTHGEATCCKACGQSYWPGTHLERLRTRARRLTAPLHGERSAV